MSGDRYGFVNRVKILLQFRADPDLPNHVGELPIHRTCISDKNIEVCIHYILLLCNLQIGRPVVLQALMYLVELCPNINVSDNDGWTPLIYAAKSGSSAIVKYLIQRGADPNLTQVSPIPILPCSVLHSSIFPVCGGLGTVSSSPGGECMYLSGSAGGRGRPQPQWRDSGSLSPAHCCSQVTPSHIH